MSPRPAGARRLCVSRAAVVRLTEARGWLAARRAGGVLVVAASRRAGQQLVREVAGQEGAAFGCHVLGLSQLAAEVVVATGEAPAPLTPLAGEAVAARAVARCRAEGPLAFFAAVEETPGFPGAVQRTLVELRRHGVGGERLSRLGPRGADLARLLAAYEAELAAGGLTDGPELLARAAAAVEAGSAPRHAALPLLLLDLPLETPSEAGFVAALAARAPEVLAAAPAADRRSVAVLETALGSPAEHLAEPAPGASRLARARRHVFGDPPPRADELDASLLLAAAPGEGAECVEIARRLLALAREGVPFDRCAVLLRDPERYQPPLEHALSRAGVPALFTRGVVRPDPAGRALLALLDCALERLSASRFAEYLSLGQVPGADAEGRPPAPAVPWVGPDEEEALAGALAAEAAEVAQAAGSADGSGSAGRAAVADGGAAGPSLSPAGIGGSGEAAAEGGSGEPAPEGGSGGPAAEGGTDAEAAEDDASPVVAGSLRAPLQWERLLVEASVVGGLDRWRRRLAGLERELEVRVAACEHDDPPRAERLRLQGQRLATLERFALPLVEALADLPTAATWGDWLERLERLAVSALREPVRVLQVLAELRPMAAVGPVGLAEVRQALAGRLGTLRASPEAAGSGRVVVSSIEEARGRSFLAVFLPGLCEGLFPRQAAEDPLLLDAERRRLAGAGQQAVREPAAGEPPAAGPAGPGQADRQPSPGDLPTQAERAQRERLLLHLALGAAEERLVASYPTVDSREGRPRVPSFYALDLARAAEGGLPGQGALRRQAAAASALRLGWPAPREAEQAVDAAEYDLAVVAPLLSAPAAEGEGRARFLLRLEPALGRSLRSRWQRWSERFTGADGLVQPGSAARAALAAKAPPERVLSPTSLQHLAACPYRFYLHSVVGLRPREEAGPLEELDPLTKGSLFHAVQALWLGELREAGRLPLAAEHLAEALDLLDRRLDELAAAERERLVPALPRVWESEIEEMRVDLRGWVREMVADGDEWVPGWFELAFGMPADAGRDPASRAEPVAVQGRLRLRGSIDLVERSPAGDLLRATDHKTGRAPDADVVVTGGGESLQPLLYALAAGEILGRPAASGRLFYCTRGGGYRSFEVPLGGYQLLALDDVLDLLERSFTEAFLPAAPREGACTWCDYRPVCGPLEDVRTGRKPASALGLLNRVRRHE